VYQAIVNAQSVSAQLARLSENDRRGVIADIEMFVAHDNFLLLLMDTAGLELDEFELLSKADSVADHLTDSAYAFIRHSRRGPRGSLCAAP
jgi:hypothetical protein